MIHDQTPAIWRDWAELNNIYMKREEDNTTRFYKQTESVDDNSSESRKHLHTYL